KAPPPSTTTAPGPPGVRTGNPRPRRAAMPDRSPLTRWVDARHSNHEPNQVFQTANLEAEPRTNRVARMYPAIGSAVAKWHGPNHPGMPAYAAFYPSRSHLAFGAYLRPPYHPFPPAHAARLPLYPTPPPPTGPPT